MVDLSIVIVNYNNRDLLREALHSVYEQTKKLTLEIIVSDNDSKDGSIEMLKEEFPQVIVLENKANLGFIKGTNKGLKIATGKTILLLNDDTKVLDHALEKMHDYLYSDPKIGMVGPKLVFADGTPQRHAGLLSALHKNVDKPKKANVISGACLMVKREVYEKIGMLDEKLFFYNDDLDWCKSCWKAGYSVMIYPDARVIHYVGSSTRKSFKPLFFVEGFRGGMYFVKKHYGELVFQLYRWVLVTGSLLILPLVLLLTILMPKKYAMKLKAYYTIFKIALSGNIDIDVTKLTF